MSSNLLSVELAGNRATYKPGETIEGTASWQTDRIKTVEVRLFWYTSGKGTRDVQIADSKHIDNPDPVGQTAFSFQLPDAPYSFSGKLISLIWTVELVIEPGNLSIRAEFVMSPDETEILLTSLPKKP